jgi:hypothetical protein
MEQSELERLRAENAQMCRQLSDATAALNTVTLSVHNLPTLALPVGGGEKLHRRGPIFGWTGAASSLGKQTMATGKSGTGQNRQNSQ